EVRPYRPQEGHVRGGHGLRRGGGVPAAPAQTWRGHLRGGADAVLAGLPLARSVVPLVLGRAPAPYPSGQFRSAGPVSTGGPALKAALEKPRRAGGVSPLLQAKNRGL